MKLGGFFPNISLPAICDCVLMETVSSMRIVIHQSDPNIGPGFVCEIWFVACGLFYYHNIKEPGS